uniref:Uncharacterized protein n=1 Tax=Quercus lobata TaxID=97700 RepID=A0A7N2LQJ5_QUELO
MDDFLMNLICPNSPSVWDGNRLSKCFNNIYPSYSYYIVIVSTDLKLLFLNDLYGFRFRGECHNSCYDFYNWNYSQESPKKPEDKHARKVVLAFPSCLWSMLVSFGRGFNFN